MTLSTHLDQLKQKHHALKVRIKQEEQSLSADHLSIAALKREKLAMKEQIERLSKSVH